MKKHVIAGDTALKLAQAERSGDAAEPQAACDQLFWFCYRNRLDPIAVLREAEALRC